MNSEERSSLNTVSLHHESLAAQAEQDRRILQGELLRQQQDFREVHQITVGFLIDCLDDDD